MDEEVKRGRKPKVTEVQAKEAPKELVREAKPKRFNEHLIIVNGKERLVSKATFDVLSKDKVNYDIEIPKGTNLAEPEIKPCVNC